MKKFVFGMITALSMFTLPTIANACQAINAAGTVGYVNVRARPDLNARVLIRWNNPERGS